MEKILSVCIPTYNMEALLSRCLDSFIFDKNYMDKLEVIVVNDGSKDGSSVIAHQYADKFPNSYIVIDKPNGNYGSCINAALKVASGKYFKICDADDRYETDNLKEFINFLENMNTDIVFSPFSTLMNNGTLKESIACPESMSGKIFSIDDINWNIGKTMVFRAMHCITTKTSILIGNNYVQTEGISYTDTQFSFYSLLYSNTCSFYNKNIYLYYLGRDGQTMSISSMKKSHSHFYLNADRMLDTYKQILYPLSDNRKSVLFDCIFMETLYYVNVVLGSLFNVSEQIKVINYLVTKSKSSFNSCPLEDKLLDLSPRYRLWKKYHVPTTVIFILTSIWRIFKL